MVVPPDSIDFDSTFFIEITNFLIFSSGIESLLDNG